MGSVLYDFFNESIFSNEKSINENFASESHDRLQQELEGYRNYSMQKFDEVIDEIYKNKSVLKVFSSMERTSLSLLKQTALYLDQFIVPDPLFTMTAPKPIGASDASIYLGFREEKLDREKLAETCKFLRNLTPMVAGNFVKLFPLNYYFERSSIPLYAPDHYFNQVLPDELLTFTIAR